MGKIKSQFIGTLDVRHLEGKWWLLLEPFGFYSSTYNITVCAPPGFVLDFSSVPRWPFVYWFAGGTGNQESVPHDLLYRWFIDNFKERLIADYIFYEGGRVRSGLRSNQTFLYRTGRFIRTLGMFTTVVLAGGLVYDSRPGCLDYRDKKCYKDYDTCYECENFYQSWIFCKLEGFRPDILELHAQC